MDRCLWVASKKIFPLSSLLKSIRPFFSELDILFFDDGESSLRENVYSYRSQFNPERLFFLKSPSFTDSFVFGHLNTSRLKQTIRDILRERNYDVIIFDGFSSFIVFEDLEELKEIRIIYRAHNIEHESWFSSAAMANNFLSSILLTFQGKVMERYEMKLASCAHKVWAIGPDDLKRFEKLSGKNNCELIPIALNFSEPNCEFKLKSSAQIKLLFLGELDCAPDRDGLKWFLREVWPYIDNNKYELMIVGNGDSTWGELLFNAPGINFLGDSRNFDEMYSECDVGIIPFRVGAGVGIKVIESVSNGLSIISTRMGILESGLTPDDYFHAENGAEWINLLDKFDLMEAKKKAHCAFNRLREIYSSELIAKRAYQTLTIHS